MSRRRYVRAMMKAIDAARTSCLYPKQTKTNGLRVIRRFERVNKIAFNPFNKIHVEQVSGCAPFESFHRGIDLFFNARESQNEQA